MMDKTQQTHITGFRENDLDTSDINLRSGLKEDNNIILLKMCSESAYISGAHEGEKEMENRMNIIEKENQNNVTLNATSSEIHPAPQSTAFTIDFDENKHIDTSKYKSMLNKFQKRYKCHTPNKQNKNFEEQCVSDNERVRRLSLNERIRTKPTIKSKMSQSISFHESCLATNPLKFQSTNNKSSSQCISWDEGIMNNSNEHNLRSLPDLGSEARQLRSPSFIKDQLEVCEIDRKASLWEDSKNEDSNSSISETGTYTIENDTYTEEQKAMMNIDLSGNAGNGTDNISYTECVSKDYYVNCVNDQRSGEEVNFENCIKSDFIQHDENAIMKECSNLVLNVENNVSSDDKIRSAETSAEKNVLEVSYFYEPQNEDKLRTRTSVLEKLKSRVRDISERTLSKSMKYDRKMDLGSFTSVTTSGVLSSKIPESQDKNRYISRDTINKCRNSLVKSEIDTIDYLEPELKRNDLNDIDITVDGLILNANCEISHAQSKAERPSKSFENSWIYQWAKSASEHNHKQLGLCHLVDRPKTLYNTLPNDRKANNDHTEHITNNQEMHGEISLPSSGFNNTRLNDVLAKLPPRHPCTSVTKIPSPISTLTRPRSRNSFSLSGSTTELNSPESYLCSTEEVINRLSNNIETCSPPRFVYSDFRNATQMNSLDSTRSKASSQYNKVLGTYKSESNPTSPQHSAKDSFTRSVQRHARHFSFDNSINKSIEVSNTIMNNSFSQNNDLYDKSYKIPYEHSHNLNPAYDYMEKNNKESCLQPNFNHLPPRPFKCFINKNVGSKSNIDQTSHPLPICSGVFVSKDNLLNQQKNSINKELFKDNIQSGLYNISSHNDIMTNKIPKHQNSPNSSPIRRSSSFSLHQTFANMNPTRAKINQSSSKVNKIVRRSTSNANVKKSNVQNRTIDSDDYDQESPNEISGYDNESDYEKIIADKKKKETITNTKCNRAFSLRRARLGTDSKSELKRTPALSKSVNRDDLRSSSLSNGNADCELDRASIRRSLRERASMPRDSSLQQMQDEGQIDTRKSTIRPRYMDISKYKSPTSTNFLRKDESKSYLSSSGASKIKSLSHNDSTRSSMRSVKSFGGKGTMKKEIAKNSTKEQELVNWRRRATYDPMKAAAEGKKKAELAKKLINTNIMTQSYNENEETTTENIAGAVLRSQSYHGTEPLAWLPVKNPNGRINYKISQNSSESQIDTSDEEITVS